VSASALGGTHRGHKGAWCPQWPGILPVRLAKGSTGPTQTVGEVADLEHRVAGKRAKSPEVVGRHLLISSVR
jgi:hypothetical protein